MEVGLRSRVFFNWDAVVKDSRTNISRINVVPVRLAQ
jgi:hypothetical protein